MEKRVQIAMFRRNGAWDGCVIESGKLQDVFAKIDEVETVGKLIPFVAGTPDGARVTFDITVQTDETAEKKSV